MDVKKLIERLRYTMRPMESRNSELVAEAADALEAMEKREQVQQGMCDRREIEFSKVKAELADERKRWEEFERHLNRAQKFLLEIDTKLAEERREYEAALDLYAHAGHVCHAPGCDCVEDAKQEIAAKMKEGKKV